MRETDPRVRLVVASSTLAAAATVIYIICSKKTVENFPKKKIPFFSKNKSLCRKIKESFKRKKERKKV